jgi:hypothetical protein
MTLLSSRAIVLSLCLSLLMVACASTGIPVPTVDYKAGYDFSKVRTFAYLPRKGGPADARVLSDMEVHRMHQAFSQALTAKGLVYVEQRQKADILASWHLVAQEKTDIRSYNATSYYQCWGCGPAVSDVSVQQYTRGTLILDLVDQDLGKSVWRGVMQSKIQEKRRVEGQQEFFNKIATAMLSSYPPG